MVEMQGEQKITCVHIPGRQEWGHTFFLFSAPSLATCILQAFNEYLLKE